MIQTNAYAFAVIPSVANNINLKAMSLWIGTGFFGVLALLFIVGTVACMIRDYRILK